jgi:hypothetical protein
MCMSCVDDDTEPLVDVTTAGLDDTSLGITDTERPVYINGTAAAAALSKLTAQIAHVSPMHTNQCKTRTFYMLC